MTSLLELAWTTSAPARRGDIVEALVEAAGALLDDGLVLAWLLRGERLVIRAASGRLREAHSGLRTEHVPGEGLIGLAARTRGVSNVPDPAAGASRAEDAEFLRAEGVRHFLGIPLGGGYALQGFLGVFSRRDGQIDGALVDRLGELAGQAALALESARLFADSERRRRAAEGLAAVAQALAHSLDAREVAHLVADSVLGLLRARDVAVYRLDAATGDLTSMAFAGTGDAHFRTPLVLPRGTGASGLAVQERRAVVTADVLTDPRFVLMPDYRAGLERGAYRAVMSTPLIVDGEPIGALGAAAMPGRVFDEESRRLLEAFADQAAVALRNARLFAGERSARAEAQAVERRFRDMVEGVDAIVTEFDTLARRTLFISGRIERLLGYAAEEWMREPEFWRDHLHPDDRERVLAFTGPEIAAGRDFVHEYRMLAADGRVVWVRDSVSVSEGRLRTLKVDITARKRSEALLAAESGVLTLIAAGEPLPRVLEAVCQVVEEHGDGMLCAMQLVEEAGALRPAPPGLPSAWSLPVLDATGVPLALLTVHYRAPRAPSDAERALIARAARLAGIAIERTRAEQALRASEERYRMLIMNIPDVVWLTDSQGSMVFVSPHVHRVGGYTAEELYRAGPAGWFGRVHPDDLPLVQRHFAALFGGPGRTFDLEYRLQHKDGRWIWLHDRAVTTYEAHGTTYAYGIYTDITDRKRAEEIRALLLNQVITVQEEERRRIARELHDETAQSLASLLLGLSALQEARTLKGARAQARDLHQVTTRALAEVRRMASGLRPSVLDDLGLPTAVARYATEFGQARRIPVAVDTAGLGDERMPPVVETALYRILQEALSNVARHAGARSVRVELDRFGAMVSMIVTDDGIGFDPERPPAPATAAHGLGIHTMRERALVLNGTLMIQSAPGRGTRVSVEIPVTEGRA